MERRGGGGGGWEGERGGEGLALRANLGSDFKRSYLENGKGIPINMVHFFRLNRPCSIDWNRFQSSRTTYKGDSKSWYGFGPWTTGKGWK